MSQPKAEITDDTDNQKDDGLFILTDVNVDTLGLVEHGAVNETFFLLKAQEGQMADELIGTDAAATDQDLTPLEELGAERVRELIGKGLEAEQVDKAGGKKAEKMMLSPGAMRDLKALIDRHGDEMPDDIVMMLADLMEDEMEGEYDEMEAKKSEVNEMAKEDVEHGSQPDEPITEPVVGDVEKADRGHDLDDLLARLEKAELSSQEARERLEKAETQLAKAEEVARQEREARELISHIEKARDFTGLGINPDEMGKALQRLARLDETANVEKTADDKTRSDVYGYFVSVLKAASAQVEEAGFYKEAGTSQQVDTKGATLVEKAQASVAAGQYPDLRTALMAATKQEAEKYLGQFEN